MVRLITVFGIGFLSFYSNVAFGHAIYIGLIEVEQTNEQTAKVIIRVFEDDFRDALRNASSDNSPISREQLCEENSTLATTYLKEHFKISINEKSVHWKLESCQLENDVYRFELNIQSPSEWKKIQFQADFLMELFPGQANMVSVLYEGNKRFLRLVKGESVGSIEL